MKDTLNKLEYKDSEIENGVNEALQRNIDAGLGKTGLVGTLNQAVKNAKERGEIDGLEVELQEQRARTREKYAGRDLLQEVKDLKINEDLPEEEKREKIAKVLDCRPDQISFTEEEALYGNDIVYHFGSLNLEGFRSAYGTIFPLLVDGGIGLENLESADNIIFPKSVGGSIILNKLKSAKNIEFPTSVGSNLYFKTLALITDLDLSNTKVDQYIYLPKDAYDKYKDELEDKYPDLAGKFEVYKLL